MAHLPVVLIIRDGWGIEPGGTAQAQTLGDAPLLAHLPFHDHLAATAPMGRLSASGEAVGLPAGQMGNSEVGHLNLGAGRIVYQNLTLIDKTIREGQLGAQPVLAELFAAARGHRLHLVGLVSDGGVHSHQNHLIALVAEAAAAGVTDIAIHAITDGRDTSPTSGALSLAAVEAGIADRARILTVIGRYFAMDRDHRWERTEKCWNAIVLGQGEIVTAETPSAAVARAYQAGQTDEFLEPLIFAEANENRFQDGDAVLFFNFRSDRGRQFSQALLDDDFPLFPGTPRGARPAVRYATMTQYDASYPCGVVFPPQSLENTLGKVVADAGLRQLRIAETEKYPHVTYFFNGGEEQPNPGEERIIVPSPKVATYDLQPEMSCPEVTARVLEKLPEVDLVILNFANPDMVGHTGDLAAAIKAVETVDAAVAQVAAKTLELGGSLLITADHGNCEQMRQPDGSPHTAHTTNLVQCWYLGADQHQVKVQDGILADVAPTLLDMLGVTPPPEMTGHSLLQRL